MPLNLNPQVSDVPVSPFFTWAQFSNRFGLKNIIQVSNKDTTMNTGTNNQPIPSGQPNWYAVQDALNYATDKIHNLLQGGILKIPLDFTPNGGVCPFRIGRAAMIIAYCDLLDMRTPDKVLTPAGWRGKSSPLTAYASELDSALMDVAAHKDGQYRQMPEAVHLSGANPGIVYAHEVSTMMGNVRYVGGCFTFVWGGRDCL